MLAAQPAAVVACVAVEVCSAAFYLDDDPGVLVSACSVWRRSRRYDLVEPRPGRARAWRCHSFATLHQPANRDRIRFEMRQGKLRNLLHPSVPALAAAAVGQLLTGERTRPGGRPISRIIRTSADADVLDAIEQTCADCDLAATDRCCASAGSIDSPSVLFALERALRDASPDEIGDS